MQFACLKKKTELDDKKKKESKGKTSSSRAAKRTVSDENIKVVPVYDEYKSSSPSLKNITTSKPVTKESTDKKESNKSLNRPSQLFSFDELKTAWLRYADKNKENLPRMYLVFQNHIPEITDTNKLKLLLDSDSQKKDFIERIHSDVMGFLKEELNNYFIEMTVELSKEIESENLIYTAIDKYKYLADLNPELENLKKKFNLDME